MNDETLMRLTAGIASMHVGEAPESTEEFVAAYTDRLLARIRALSLSLQGAVGPPDPAELLGMRLLLDDLITVSAAFGTRAREAAVALESATRGIDALRGSLAAATPFNE